MNDLDKAKKLLDEGRTFAIIKGDIIFESRDRGISPLLDLVENVVLSGFSAADKIVGKAAALLYIFGKVSEVYAEVITKQAVALLNDNGIAVSYGLLVEKIINRAGDDVCPMEKAVSDVNLPAEAVSRLRIKLNELGTKSNRQNFC